MEQLAASSRLVIYVDGLCEPRNPGGWACWGWWTDGYSEHGIIGHGTGMTNNVAEYHAALAALAWALDQGLLDVVVRSDSRLLVEQVSGRWRCESERLRPLLAELRQLAAGTRARFEWVPREQNERADRLSREAYAGRHDP